ncbi:MAG: adenine phosphoribosyltransferase [Chloroflexi bacterium]|nr:adenine phosphoribosyltransferase [Chloroflexota bacterium]
MELKSYIRDIPDFPQRGIMFRDITPLLHDPNALRYAVDQMAKQFGDKGIDVVVGVESRGFIFGAPLAYKMGASFVPVRKQGKLPWETFRAEYSLEYGTSVVEVHRDGIAPGNRVLIVDDLLATGGTAQATAQLVEQSKGAVVGLSFVVELGYLQGRERLSQYPIFSLVQY